MIQLLIVNFFIGLLLLPAYGNDTVATVESGNVTFKKSNEISMESEELLISPDRIKVKYLFHNSSKKPIHDTVVFPLPDSNSVGVGWEGGEDMLAGKNALNFVLKENNKLKPVEVHAKKININSNESDIFGIESFYSWEQDFPAEKTIQIEHEYNTHPGSGGNVTFDEDDKKKYCMDETFLKSFEKIKLKILKNVEKKYLNATQKELGTYLHYNSFSHVSYILKTANNWSGPIKKFKLRIKKDKASTIMSLCWDGLKKVSDLEFESSKENFSPTSDLKIIFIHIR